MGDRGTVCSSSVLLLNKLSCPLQWAISDLLLKSMRAWARCCSPRHGCICSSLVLLGKQPSQACASGYKWWVRPWKSLYGGLRIPTVRDNPLTQNPDSHVASGLFLSSKPAKTSGVSPKHSGICYLPIYLAFRLKPHHLLSCPDFAFFKSVTSNLRRCPAQWPRGVYSVPHNLAGFFFNITPLPVLKLRRF